MDDQRAGAGPGDDAGQPGEAPPRGTRPPDGLPPADTPPVGPPLTEPAQAGDEAGPTEEAGLPPEKIVVGWETGVQWVEGDPATPATPSAGWGAAAPPTPQGDFWVRPSGALTPLPPPRGALRIRSVIGRSLDLYLRRPVPFLLLNIPAAIVSGASSLLYVTGSLGPTSFASGTPQALGPMAAFGLLFGLIALIVGIATSLSMALAADDVRAGRQVHVAQRVRQGFSRTAVAVLSAILEFLAIIVVLFIGFIAIALLALTRSGALIGIGILGLVVVVLWITIRWALSITAIALEPVGPLEALGRSRAVTRGNVWRIVGVYFLFALLILPMSIGIGFLSLALFDVPLLSVAISLAASLVTIPLASIISTMIFGDLTGRPEAAPDPRSPQLRAIFVAALLIGGVLAVAIAIPRIPAAMQRIVELSIPAQARGVIVASPVRNPFDACLPIATRGALPRTIPIWVGGYLTKPIPAGATGQVEVYIDGQLLNTVTLRDPNAPISCWHEPEAIDRPFPGTWRIVVTSGGQTLAEGTFVVR